MFYPFPGTKIQQKNETTKFFCTFLLDFCRFQRISVVRSRFRILPLDQIIQKSGDYPYCVAQDHAYQVKDDHREGGGPQKTDPHGVGHIIQPQIDQPAGDSSHQEVSDDTQDDTDRTHLSGDYRVETISRSSTVKIRTLLPGITPGMPLSP